MSGPGGHLGSMHTMTPSSGRALIAVDIGNSRLKFGWFDPDQRLVPGELPQPRATLVLAPSEMGAPRLPRWLDEQQLSAACWQICSVQRELARGLVAWIGEYRPGDPIRQLTHEDLSLRVALDAPEKVGLDRLAAAVAANWSRNPACPAIVVDLGTAITVDLVTADGAFAGGTIVPGVALGARALHEFTDALPLVEMDVGSEPPEVLGRSTVEAMQSGLYWGAVGAIRELIARLSADASQREQLGAFPPESSADVILSGGAAHLVAGAVGPQARVAPHLVLSGIALAVHNQGTRYAEK
jgi:type III pantothenate kinase